MLNVRVIERNPIPEEFSLIIGDAVHNIRSALDLLGFHVAKNSGTSVGDKVGQFPTKETRDDAAILRRLDKEGWLLGGSELADYLITLEPFRGGRYQLWELHEIDIIDKHRLLLTLAELVDFSGYIRGPLTISNAMASGTEIIATFPTGLSRRVRRAQAAQQDNDLGFTAYLRLNELQMQPEPALDILWRWHSTVTNIVTRTERILCQ